MLDLPSYDDLPIRPGLPAHSSWGLWGDDDRLGCLNLLTAATARAGAALIRTGEGFPLNLELTLPSPPLFGRSPLQHAVLDLGPLEHDDELAGFNTQGSSQWDGFRHVQHSEHGFYNGLADADHGVAHWAVRPLTGRAVVCDVARWREAQGRPIDLTTSDVITPADVLATLDAQATVVQPGDVLLIHTGWLDWYRTTTPEVRNQLAELCHAPGLEPGETTARMLWDLHVAAVAADNPGLETEPVQPDSAHRYLLPLLGMPIGELFVLGPLAAACAREQRWECFFTSAPLNLPEGVASPPNAIAIL